MQASNFSWSRSVFLTVNGQQFDLHNDFNFQSTSYDVIERQVILRWKRGTGDWIKKNLPSQLTLVMQGVSEVRMKPRDASLPFSEDDCLASFGYDSDEDWADGQFWVDKEPDPKWRWSFLFQSGAEIQVTGDTALVEVFSQQRSALEGESDMVNSIVGRCLGLSALPPNHWMQRTPKSVTPFAREEAKVAPLIAAADPGCQVPLQDFAVIKKLGDTEILPKHKASCHCGAVVLELALPDGIVDPRRCDCSMCRRRGAIAASVPLSGLTVLKGADVLALYQFNTKTAKHFFCSVCGIYTHHQRRSSPEQYGYNVACLEGVNPFDLGEVVTMDGVNHPSDREQVQCFRSVISLWHLTIGWS